ncbi:hypothetical protein AcW1_008010 [Taiwanofungus camphoratus]|nr:hypothetical protein AcW1_008010 [Antrodia cinnamomea]
MDSLVSLKVAFQFSQCFLADFQCGNELDLLARFGIDVDYTVSRPFWKLHATASRHICRRSIYRVQASIKSGTYMLQTSAKEQHVHGNSEVLKAGEVALLRSLKQSSPFHPCSIRNGAPRPLTTRNKIAHPRGGDVLSNTKPRRSGYYFP